MLRPSSCCDAALSTFAPNSLLAPTALKTRSPSSLFAMAHARCHTINAPSAETPPRGTKTIFLAGTTSRTDDGDWRSALTASLSDVPITLCNPNRADWDSSWREDIDFAPFREQVEWELEKAEQADLVVVYFHPATQAPISLLELGLCARAPGKALVVCPEGYWKRGNVQAVCRKYGVEMAEDVDGLKDAIVRKLSLGG